MSNRWIRTAAWTVCGAIALSVLLPMQADARGRGRQSNFVMTPSGPIPKTIAYADNMSPQQWAATRKAEIAEYEKYLKANDPNTYKQYLEWKKKQTSGSSTTNKAPAKK